MEVFDLDISNIPVVMELNYKMRLLDQKICKYVTSIDPNRKSPSKSVFMRKKELESFYGKIYSKAKQEIQLQSMQNKNHQDANKLLIKEQQRIREKIYSGTFYLKCDSVNSQNLSNKENIKINEKPLIQNNSFNGQKLIKRQNGSKFLEFANKKLLMNYNSDKNQINRLRKTKSLAFGNRFLKRKSNSKITQQNLSDNINHSVAQGPFNQVLPHQKVQLIQLYQKLYQEFKKPKSNDVNYKTRIQGKFLKSSIPQKHLTIKARQSVLRYQIGFNNKRSLLKL